MTYTFMDKVNKHIELIKNTLGYKVARRSNFIDLCTHLKDIHHYHFPIAWYKGLAGCNCVFLTDNRSIFLCDRSCLIITCCSEFTIWALTDIEIKKLKLLGYIQHDDSLIYPISTTTVTDA